MDFNSGFKRVGITVAVPLACSVLSLMFAAFLSYKLNQKPTGAEANIDKVDRLAAQIKSGAKSFLKEEYKYLAVFVAFLAVVLFIIYATAGTGEVSKRLVDATRIVGAFLLGATLSAAAGWLGMNTATNGNVRTTVACAKGTLNDGLQVAFCCGSVMGFVVVGLGLLGLSLAYLVLSISLTECNVSQEAWQLLSGFGFGASSIALFARVAGGIYTKAADVGADLVGKVEAGIDEDDPHNPAVIADNVGDNVGDVAGMGADLFESYVGSMIAAAALGASLVKGDINGSNEKDPACSARVATIALPLWISSAGILCSMVGYFFVSTKSEGKGWEVKLSELFFALEKGMYSAGLLFIGLAALIVYILFDVSIPENDPVKGDIKIFGWKCLACIVIGLVAGGLIGKVTEYFTSFDYGPVISIKDRAATGPATVVIQGLGVGMISCLPPVVILATTILACSALADSYGVAIAAVGMLATLGITLATDAYGPVADNAGGLAEMALLGPEVRAKTDSLDALGNTTAATGKGFAIGSAVLTSLSLLAAFKAEISKDLLKYELHDSVVLAGLLIGAMLPFLFASLTMISVGKAAAEIIHEVRRQFREIPGLRKCIERASRGETIPPEEDVEPDSDKCVAISTRSSVREMIAPGTYAILAPVSIGFLVGAECLLGLLAGSIASGAVLAIMMSNSGGAWDNSKKLCEKLKIKKTDVGKACIVGDTVGDPFKDTSGPSLNILIKLMAMVSLTIAPILKTNPDKWQLAPFGIIPLAICAIVTIYLMCTGALTWKDPLATVQDATAKKGDNDSNGVDIIIDADHGDASTAA